MDGLEKIPAATAEDFEFFESKVRHYDGLVRGSQLNLRVAAHYARRAAEAERLLRELVREGDLGWTLTDENQLYVEVSKASIDDARKFLEAK